MLIPLRSIEKLKPTWRPCRRSVTPLALESCAVLLPPAIGHAGADGRVNASDVAWSVNVERGADEVRRRDADQGARADAANSERNSLSPEGESAAAAGYAEDETGAGDMQGNRARRGFGRRDESGGRETGAR